MQAVVDICYPWREWRPRRRIWVSIVSVALMNVGRTPEAIQLLREAMQEQEPGPGDYYDLACMFTRSGQYTEALQALLEGLSWDCFDRFKALVDSDLQALWMRLPDLLPVTKKDHTLMHLIVLGQMPLLVRNEMVWDPPDPAKLPPDFGRWLVYAPQRVGWIMDHQAPDNTKRRFKEWTLNRARSAQRMIRRGMQKCKMHR